MLHADEARKITDEMDELYYASIKKQWHNVILIIENHIKEAASRRKNLVRLEWYQWGGYSLSKETFESRFQIKSCFATPDDYGTETLTELGEFVRDTLVNAGYVVYLGVGYISISWTKKK